MRAGLSRYRHPQFYSLIFFLKDIIFARMGGRTLELFMVPEERELRESLSENLNIPLLRQIAGKIPPKQSDKEFYYNLKAHSVMVKNGIIQSLGDIFTELKSKLGISDRQVDLYVSSDDPFSCRYYGGNSDFFPAIIYVGNELLERLDKSGLAYVLGHELGHLVFEHAELREAISLLYPSKDRLPPNIRNQLNLLDKLQEISADRIGFFASGDLESSVKAMIILASGLNDNLLKLTLDQIFDYSRAIMEELKKLKVYPDIKHPAIPLRILALKAFAESELYRSVLAGEPVSSDPALASRMGELTELIKIYPAEPQEYWMMMAKAAAIYLIVAADKEITNEEKTGLLDIISNFCWCPGNVLKEIQEKGAQTFLKVGVGYFRLNNPSRIDEILGEMARFVVRDRKIDNAEYDKYIEIAKEFFGFDENKALAAIVAATNIYLRN